MNKADIAGYELTYKRGRIERVTATYYLESEHRMYFKDGNGTVLYSVSADALLSVETLTNNEKDRVVTRVNAT